MNILFLSPYIPVRLVSGNKVFTYHLLKALSVYANVTIVGYLDSHKLHSGTDLEIFQVQLVHPGKKKAASLLSGYPNIIYQTMSRKIVQSLKEVIKTHDYDVIIYNHLNVYWLAEKVDQLLGQYNKKIPKTILLTHNYETQTRYSMFKAEKNVFRKFAYLLDTIKLRIHEQKAFNGFDVITAITEKDAAAIRKISKKRVEVLGPGYSGPVHERILRPYSKRQVVMLGSFFWEAKQSNLKEFIRAADQRFYENKIMLKIVGSGPDLFMNNICQGTRSVEFTGWVDSFNDHLLESRISVVPEICGGGFKLKTLDYIFHNLPMFAIKGSVAGLPLVPGRDFYEAQDMDLLVEAIIAHMDDMDFLNQLGRRALDKCRRAFSWESRGRNLAEISGYNCHTEKGNYYL